MFGLNGAGKSGYSRLLRRVCRSREADEVLHDVFDPGAANAPQTAQLVAHVDGVERTFEIDLANDPDRALSAISAFDAGRARLCLGGPNIIEHRPRSLRLVRDLAGTQDALVEELRNTASARREKLGALPSVDPETTAGRAHAEIDETTDVAALLEQHRLDEHARRDFRSLRVLQPQPRPPPAASWRAPRGCALPPPIVHSKRSRVPSAS